DAGSSSGRILLRHREARGLAWRDGPSLYWPGSGEYTAGPPRWRPACRPPRRVTPLRVDLHCHSSASDGALSPQALCQRAVERQIGLLAITDHDTVAGYRAARAWLAQQ